MSKIILIRNFNYSKHLAHSLLANSFPIVVRKNTLPITLYSGGNAE